MIEYQLYEDNGGGLHWVKRDTDNPSKPQVYHMMLEWDYGHGMRDIVDLTRDHHDSQWVWEDVKRGWFDTDEVHKVVSATLETGRLVISWHSQTTGTLAGGGSAQLYLAGQYID